MLPLDSPAVWSTQLPRASIYVLQIPWEGNALPSCLASVSGSVPGLSTGTGRGALVHKVVDEHKRGYTRNVRNVDPMHYKCHKYLYYRLPSLGLIQQGGLMEEVGANWSPGAGS